jgi:hypothetical protein
MNVDRKTFIMSPPVVMTCVVPLVIDLVVSMIYVKSTKSLGICQSYLEVIRQGL